MSRNTFSGLIQCDLWIKKTCNNRKSKIGKKSSGTCKNSMINEYLNTFYTIHFVQSYMYISKTVELFMLYMQLHNEITFVCYVHERTMSFRKIKHYVACFRVKRNNLRDFVCFS